MADSRHSASPLPQAVTFRATPPIHWQSILKPLLAGINPVLTLLRWLLLALSRWVQSTCPVRPELWGTVPGSTPGVNVSSASSPGVTWSLMILPEVSLTGWYPKETGLSVRIAPTGSLTSSKAAIIQLELISLQLYLLASTHSPFYIKILYKIVPCRDRLVIYLLYLL